MSDIPLGKMLGEFLTKKGVSAHRNLVIFSKKIVLKNYYLRFKNMQNTQIPKKTSNGVQEPLIKSYEQILNLRIWKFKSYFPLGKWLIIDGKSKNIDGKGVSAPSEMQRNFSLRWVCYIPRYILYVNRSCQYVLGYSQFLSTVLLFSFIRLFFQSLLISKLYIN